MESLKKNLLIKFISQLDDNDNIPLLFSRMHELFTINEKKQIVNNINLLNIVTIKEYSIIKELINIYLEHCTNENYFSNIYYEVSRFGLLVNIDNISFCKYFIKQSTEEVIYTNLLCRPISTYLINYIFENVEITSEIHPKYILTNTKYILSKLISKNIVFDEFKKHNIYETFICLGTPADLEILLIMKIIPNNSKDENIKILKKWYLNGHIDMEMFNNMLELLIKYL